LLHDAGKADVRFQRWRHDDEVDTAKAEAPNAKSSHVSSRNRAARTAVRRRIEVLLKDVFEIPKLVAIG
jgi:hypothetical protein